MQFQVTSRQDRVYHSAMVEIIDRVSCVALVVQQILRVLVGDHERKQREDEGDEDAGGHDVEIFLQYKMKRDFME